MSNDFGITHSVHWGINPLSKTPPPLSCQALLKLANCPSPFFRQSALYIGFSWTRPLPLKVGFFSELLKYYSFSSSIPSYLLKVTKFLGAFSQFEFLVITRKNIFAYKLFLSLNVSDFNFLCDNCKPPWKSPPPSFPATSL